MRRFRLVCSVENHFRNGGFGSMIAEIAVDHAIGCRVLRIGASDDRDGRSGSTAFMHRHRGISAEQVAQAVRTAWDQLR